MKSWLSFLLPNDEYKEKKILYFLSEGSIVLLIALFSIFISSRYVFNFQLDIEFALFASIFIFLGYVLLRYIISGMEYTDVATEHAYKKELKHIFSRTCSFGIIYMLLYFIFVGIPSKQNEWGELLGLLLSICLIWFIISFISLKISYKKNKELL
ncbi:MAG: DUF3278 domain-containing protein [Bacillota bacterium]|uniref:DUF3278 domain-containing protein n=1 Tax=Virgibacillus salarius TaxID=447199 RepID=A0A941IAP0_9BACI|nr:MULTISPECIES: hypothetical protein [Bacillaceae]NAZ10862.1 DUF3278 domain-containing protein [Agaribacter marinus]MBR7798154.1 DUF3278 domain-containing protein [Virgibacillus salarius]MCC2250439.1 DUF3278 domain-containing protein [Virgibacillus sp. AGTR]MDY7046533.1 DUF3278 domain-containing protein [Virgibacillus sp. M23]QRZ19857.1 DUF3278 domain-containing protein [Virgibacillus sp. AGTR]